MIKSRNHSNEDVDSQQLRALLTSISAQLTIPFLERRGRGNLHKQKPVEELQDTIAELCEKERELTAAVGIAKMLLDKNDSLQSKNIIYREGLNKLTEENRILRSELINYNELLEKGENNYAHLTETLIKTETELLRASVENQRSVAAKDRICEILENEVTENDYFEMKEFFQSQLEKHKRKLYIEAYSDIEKKYLGTKSEYEKLHESYTNIKEQYEKICMKHTKIVERLKETEKMNRIIVEAKEKVDKKYKQLSISYLKLKEDAERLDEELKLSEILQKTKTSTSESIHESKSLLSELQCIDFSFTDMFPMKLSIEDLEEGLFSQTYPDKRYSYTPKSKIFLKNSQYFEIIFYDSITIQTSLKQQRKDPSEEYFILTVQAVKMNSPYMETICVIPHATLYEKALFERVPFHLWRSWIESQLNFEYIQKLYEGKGQKPNTLNNFLRKF